MARWLAPGSLLALALYSDVTLGARHPVMMAYACAPRTSVLSMVNAFQVARVHRERMHIVMMPILARLGGTQRAVSTMSVCVHLALVACRANALVPGIAPTALTFLAPRSAIVRIGRARFAETDFACVIRKTNASAIACACPNRVPFLQDLLLARRIYHIGLWSSQVEAPRVHLRLAC